MLDGGQQLPAPRRGQGAAHRSNADQEGIRLIAQCLVDIAHNRYAMSKWRATQGLGNIHSCTGAVDNGHHRVFPIADHPGCRLAIVPLKQAFRQYRNASHVVAPSFSSRKIALMPPIIHSKLVEDCPSILWKYTDCLAEIPRCAQHDNLEAVMLSAARNLLRVSSRFVWAMSGKCFPEIG